MATDALWGSAIVLLAMLALLYGWATMAIENAPDSIAITVRDYVHGKQTPEDGRVIYERAFQNASLAQRIRAIFHKTQVFPWLNPGVNCPLDATVEAHAWYFTFGWHNVPVEWVRIEGESCLPEHVTTLRGPSLESRGMPLPEGWQEMHDMTGIPMP